MRRRSTTLVAAVVAVAGLVVALGLDQVDDGDETSAAPTDPCAATAPLVAVARNDPEGVGGSEITVIRPDGSREVVTDDDWVATHPAISPDHQRLAVTRVVGDHESAGPEAEHIWTLGLDGADPRPLTEGDVSDTAPTWSPDGATIAFVRTAFPEASILTVPPDGGEAEELVPGEADVMLAAPEWSPDGTRLAFIRRRLDPTGQPAEAEVWTVAADGSGATRVGRADLDAELLDWHPDGTRLLVSAYQDGEGHLAVVDVATGESTIIARNATFGRWSRGGAQIVHHTRTGVTEERTWRLVESPLTGTTLGDDADLDVTEALYTYLTLAVADCGP